VERRDPHAGLLPPVISVITITGIGDHLQPEWLITFTGMRNQWMAHINDRFQRRPKQVLLPIIPWLRHRVPQRK
jgi:hypothetical protein